MVLAQFPKARIWAVSQFDLTHYPNLGGVSVWILGMEPVRAEHVIGDIPLTKME